MTTPGTHCEGVNATRDLIRIVRRELDHYVEHVGRARWQLKGARPYVANGATIFPRELYRLFSRGLGALYRSFSNGALQYFPKGTKPYVSKGTEPYV